MHAARDHRRCRPRPRLALARARFIIWTFSGAALPDSGGWMKELAVMARSTVTEWTLAYKDRICHHRLITSVTKRPWMKICISVTLKVPPKRLVPNSMTNVFR